MITFADISARKRAEGAVNAAMLQAQSANQGKTRFLAAASHDLRQPLQTLSLLLGLLGKRLQDPAALQLVARGQEALTAMSSMLNTLLDINQLEAGVVRPDIVEFRIDDLLGALKAEFAYHTQSKGLDWRVLPSEAVVRTDPRLLNQMVRNLLSNASSTRPKAASCSAAAGGRGSCGSRSGTPASASPKDSCARSSMSSTRSTIRPAN